MSDTFYLRSVHKRWQQVLGRTCAQALICSPYLTPKLALSVIQAARPERCAVYTRFSLEDFASGASSLRVVDSLIKHGYPVFEIQALHAKILLVSNEFVSIGSQNLTARGVRNREATFCSNVPDEVAQVEDMLATWIEGATRITAEMVEDAMRLLGPIEASFRKLQDSAAKAEAEVRAAQAMRDEQARLAQAARDAVIRREAERQAEAARVRRSLAYSAKTSIERRMPDGQVPLYHAKAFIRRSTWWNTHASGSPVLASAFAERITGKDGDWQVKFGANSFLVGRAISKCTELLRQYIDGFESGSPIKPGLVIGILRTVIRSSVAGYDGTGLGKYPVKGDDMHFGAHSIDVRYFIKELLESLPPEIVGPLQEANERASL